MQRTISIQWCEANEQHQQQPAESALPKHSNWKMRQFISHSRSMNCEHHECVCRGNNCTKFIFILFSPLTHLFCLAAQALATSIPIVAFECTTIIIIIQLLYWRNVHLIKLTMCHVNYLSFIFVAVHGCLWNSQTKLPTQTFEWFNLFFFQIREIVHRSLQMEKHFKTHFTL